MNLVSTRRFKSENSLLLRVKSLWRHWWQGASQPISINELRRKHQQKLRVQQRVQRRQNQNRKRLRKETA